MNLGEKIRYFRRVKNLSQQELAAGICSVPYLSKIENGVTEPSEEIQQHLATRLDISLNYLNENEIIHNFVSLFHSIYQRDYSSAKDKYYALINLPPRSVDEDILQKIFKSIYIMMTTEEIPGVESLLNEVSYIEDVIKGQKAFYYFLAKGLLSYLKKDFEEAIQYLYKAESFIEEYHHQEWEKGYLFYMIGLTANQLYYSIVGLEYTKRALDIFEKSYYFRRCADCRVIIAIIHLRIRNFDESAKQLRLAETIADSFNDKELKGVIYHNLGGIANHKGETHKAIELYIKSLEAKEKEPLFAKVMTIYALIKEYEKIADYEKGLALLETWLAQVTENPLYREYELHFLYHKHIFTHGEHNDSSIQFMTKELLPYFEQRNEWVHLSVYYPIVGSYFENTQKYKQASKYYSMAYNALRRLHDLGVTYV